MTFTKTIGWTVVTIIIICILGKICAAFREILIANYFGVGENTDSYVVATSIPFRFGMLIGAVFYTAFVPMFSKYLLIDKKDAYAFFNTCFTLLIFVLALGAGLLLYYANFWVRLLAPGLSFNSLNISVKLMQIMTVAFIVLGVSNLLRAVNSINQHYFISSVYDTSANIINLIALLIFVPFFGIYGLAIGLVLGIIGQLLIQGIAFLKNFYPDNFKINLLHPGIKEFFLAVIPLFITVTMVELNFFIMRGIASVLPAGSISALNFGFTVIHLPVGILDLIIITVIFPYVSGLVNQNRLNEVGQIVSKLVKAVFFVLLPLSVFIIIFRKLIIEILFQRGAFDLLAAQKTTVALYYFSFGLFAWGIDYLLFRIFYLIKEIKIYNKLLLIRVGLNTILSIILVKYFMHGGIALAFSVALIFHLFLSVNILRIKLPHFNVRGISAICSKVVFASIIMGLSIYFAGYVMNNSLVWINNSVIGKFLYMSICGVIGITIYLLCSKLIMAEEIILYRDLLRHRTVKLTPFPIEG